ncbi:hypothetical protein R83H12_03135 [Fibrobacteria bacterium R8-3-H12]
MSPNTKQQSMLALIRDAIDGKCTVKEIALRFHLSERRIKQLKKAFRERGEMAVIHGNKGRKPSHALSDGLKKRIAAKKNEGIYKDMNFSHFREHLESDFGIRISYHALYSILKGEGIDSKKGRRCGKMQIHRHRERRACFGELLQADATSFKWFGTNDYFTLHGFMDDATGKITSLYMSKSECLLGYIEALRITIAEYGIPMELYTNKSIILCANEKDIEFKDMNSNNIRKTQFGKMLEKLGINPIFANSPQAKGRVERMWGALQDKLTIYFKKNRIETIEQANEILPAFIKEHNAKFGTEPASRRSCFVRVGKNTDMNKILAVKHERITDGCGTFSFKNLKFQVEAKENMAGKKIIFMFSDKIGIVAQAGDKCYSVRNPTPNAAKELFKKCFLKNVHS